MAISCYLSFYEFTGQFHINYMKIHAEYSVKTGIYSIMQWKYKLRVIRYYIWNKKRERGERDGCKELFN